MARGQVALKLHSTLISRKTQRFVHAEYIRNNGVCVRVRTAGVRVVRLENRQGRKPFVSSNLTLSPKLYSAYDRH